MKKLGKRWLRSIERSDDPAAWVPVVAEIASGSAAQYALDKRSGQLVLKRALSGGLSYPTNYGFVVGTFNADDGMELDVLILSSVSLSPLSIVKVRTIGGLVIDSADKGEEAKLVGVALGDPSVERYTSISEIPREVRDRIEHFFRAYKEDRGVATRIEGWFERPDALRRLERGFEAAQNRWRS
jgi:inorganic pyrophosphatase